MRETNLKTLDLNLLLALNALLEEKHVTRAAERMSLSQPAMSRALARLRDMFQDPLLVKGTRGMALTARAIDLYHPLQTILREISHIVSPPSVDPATMQGEIVIATRDYELATLFPSIISKITAQAPMLKLSVVSLSGDDLNPLEHHNVDFVLAGSEKKSATLHRYTLYQESFICVVSKNNAVIQDGMNLETYIQMKHCFVSIANFGLSIVDTALLKKNLKRHVVVRVPHFLAVSHIVSNSNLIATIPRRLGELLAKQENVVLMKPPFSIPRFPIYLYWHVRNQHNPIHQWLRKVIRASC
jgi:DNA-binding transcriptional LysR family regulator